MDKRSLITVIVPFYNAEKTIEKCLKTLVNQNTKANYEVLLIDDGSTDSSKKIIEQYVRKYRFLKLFSKDNSGPSDTRNYGLSLVQTSFVTFVDSDDYIEPFYIETFYEMIAQYKNKDLYILGYQKEKENGEVIFKSSHVGKQVLSAREAQKEIFISGDFEGYTWNKLFRMDLIIEQNLQFNQKISLYEDLYFVLEYLKNSQNIYIKNTNAYHYVKHGDSIVNSGGIGNYFSDRAFNSLSVIKDMRKLILPKNTDAQVALEAKICWTAVSLLRSAYGAPDRNQIPQKVFVQLKKDMKINRDSFLKSTIFPKRDKVIYWLNWYCPRTFAFLWKKLGLHGNG